MNANRSKCERCGLDLIAEERETHSCQKKQTDYHIKGNKLWFFDGFTWRIHTLKTVSPPKMGQPFKTPEDGTESQSGLCPVLGCFRSLSHFGW